MWGRLGGAPQSPPGEGSCCAAHPAVSGSTGSGARQAEERSVEQACAGSSGCQVVAAESRRALGGPQGAGPSGWRMSHGCPEAPVLQARVPSPQQALAGAISHLCLLWPEAPVGTAAAL